MDEALDGNECSEASKDPPVAGRDFQAINESELQGERNNLPVAGRDFQALNELPDDKNDLPGAGRDFQAPNSTLFDEIKIRIDAACDFQTLQVDGHDDKVLNDGIVNTLDCPTVNNKGDNESVNKNIAENLYCYVGETSRPLRERVLEHECNKQNWNRQSFQLAHWMERHHLDMA